MPFINDSEDSSLEPIAIVGMACRLPGAIDSPAKLWDALLQKKSVQTPKVPESRFNIDAFYHPDLARPGSFTSLGGYFLDGHPEDFDASFFGITPIEAMWLDPQQKKMLEVCYECLESGGVLLEDIAGTNTGVFVGTFTNDYQQMTMSESDFRHSYAATGVDVGIMSNRIGNVFDLNGPSFTINTACSSSVYAIHNACNALRARDCDAVIAGGVNLILTVDQHMNTAKLGVLSPTSTCHTFDASADGYGRAEGAGAFYLKRLSSAIRDGNVIRGVIRSSAVNTNGKVDGMGITYPSVHGQERVIRTAYQRANLDPNKTAYFEAHGTGTPTGDPIEVRAVSNAMNDTRSRDAPLLIGAVKANLGHSEAASGIFAVMKCAMMTETGLIPGVCGFKTLNPKIRAEEWNVKVNEDLRPYPQEFDVKRASCSSFGYGGSNAHVIVESIDSICPWYEHGRPKSESPYTYNSKRPLLLGMSAHSDETLRRNIAAHQAVIESYHLVDVAYTLNSRRSRFAKRATTIARADDTDLFDARTFNYGASIGKSVKIGFVFTGQGAQWARMGWEAMTTFPVFSDTINVLDNVLQSLTPKPEWTIASILAAPADTSRIGEAQIAQPVCTAVQIAIVDLFATWNIEPTVTIGHSSGEIGAAYASGRLSAAGAILAAFFRGRAVTEAAPEGSMLAVGTSAEGVLRFIPADLRVSVTIACENSPESVTLSGSAHGITTVKGLCDEAGVFARELRTGKAYHSSQMNAVAPLYQDLWSEAQARFSNDLMGTRRAVCPMVSSVTGSILEDTELSIQYWCDNLRSRVRFETALRELSTSQQFADVTTLVEIGPHSALGGPVKQIFATHGIKHLSYMASLKRGGDSAVALLTTAGHLFNQGLEVDFTQINAETAEKNSKSAVTPRYLPDLPTYQWSYENRNFYEPRAVKEKRVDAYMRHDILGRRIHGLSDNASVWRNIVRQRDIPWLEHHRLGDSVIFPAAGHLSLAAEALLQLLGSSDIYGVSFRSIDIRKALVIPEHDEGVEVHTRLEKLANTDGGRKWLSFAVESFDDGDWTVHVQGRISATVLDNRQRKHEFQWPFREVSLHHKVHQWYEAFHRVGFNYGASFQTMKTVRSNGRDQAASSDIRVQTTSGLMPLESRYMLHPSTIDGILHLVIASINKGLHKEMPHGVVPLTIEEANLYFPDAADMENLGEAVAWTSRVKTRYSTCHAQLRGKSGRLLMDISNIVAVDYEAVLNQSLSRVIAREPFATTSWVSCSVDQGRGFSTMTMEREEAEALKSIGIVSLTGSDEMSIAIEETFQATLTTHSSALASFNISGCDYIIINECSGSMLMQPNAQDFSQIKALLCAGKPTLWLTKGSNSGNSAVQGIAAGFLRALRSELVASQLTLLDVDEDVATDKICPLAKDLLSRTKANISALDSQFWLKSDGTLHVPRIVANEKLNSKFFGEVEPSTHTLGTEINYQGVSGESGIIFEERDPLSTPLAPDEVEMRITHSELSHDDWTVSDSKPRIVVGKVTKIGAKCASYLDQQVVAYTTSMFTTSIRTSVFHRIGPLSAADAVATLPDLCKAVSALVTFADARRGDGVIVLSEQSEFADMLIALGRMLGVNVARLNSAGEELKAALSAHDHPRAIIATASYGPLSDAWRITPPHTRFVLHEVNLQGAIDAGPFVKGASLVSSNLTTLLESNSRSLDDILRRSVELLSRSDRPWAVQQSQLDVTDLSTFENPGSIILPQANVLMYDYGTSQINCRKRKEEVQFSPTAAYVLSGCLGGLGRSLTTWMLGRGCRNFVFLSRSGKSKPEAARLITSLEQAGANAVVHQTDAGDEEAVASIVEEISKKMPIKGVLHAAMVLQDGMFESMTVDQYTKAIDPKVKGAWSLHKALGDTKLDFFVMTSSISSILGNPGQANYCAGNSFLDALAVYRRKLGLTATSVALPMVLDVGVVAENASLESSLARKGLYGISEKEMIQAFEASMSADSHEPHLVLGLEPAFLVTALTAAEKSDAFWFQDARLGGVRGAVEAMLEEASQGRKNAAVGGFVSSLESMQDEIEVVDAIAQHISLQIAKILMLPADGVQIEGKSILSHGLDSMIGAELRSWLFTELAVEIGFQSLLSPKMTVKTLAQQVRDSMRSDS